MPDEPRKRAAIEPPTTLFGREAQPAPTTNRPVAVSGGAALVVARAGGAVLWGAGLLREWGSIRAEFELSGEESMLMLGILLGLQALWMLLLLVLAWLVWRGSNIARSLVMLGAAVSITASAVSYFTSGEEITVRTTLLTLALDILILLALSSRDARAWTRRPRA
ncbi:hypothetical protein [Leucobacter sp. wl10]|uniref:hypothetical protein n=1 Tax=Leucobacter sp. wl10 TaxID=2304677 RepID=UPI000E5BE6BF|nr:hypothetical protein [Leucobacter sp. wl10]RGE17356.1 hypothetical protein D1J51_15970 [Leucobacter sp. wl10]